MEKMHAFSFQKRHRELGCEDAPPVSEKTHLIVCDGLGGSGKDKLSIEEDGRGTIRTSAYVGSRILAAYTDRMIRENYEELKSEIFSKKDVTTDDFTPFIRKWYGGLDDAYAKVRVKLRIAPPQEGERMLFPSTLAACVMCPYEGRLRLLVFWAGDSRVYLLTGKKGLQQLTMDDCRNPNDPLIKTSHMTNCLAHQKGRNHRVNYAYCEVEDDGLVFACSDGVTDYLPSPMTLERVMLLLGEKRTETDPDEFALEFGYSISDILFKTIYDDTTMAGCFWNVEGREGFLDTYGERIDEMVPLFEEADEILLQKEEKKTGLLGLFGREPEPPEADPRFREIWKEYVPGYQRFMSLMMRRMYEDEL